MKVTPPEIAVVAGLVAELCGVVLDETKGYLINNRLANLVEDTGCASFGEFCQMARTDRTLQGQIIDMITTQETRFFRDVSPFKVLGHKVLPDLINAKAGTPGAKNIRIWSAACATGQEPYSIAMTLCDLIPDLDAWDVNILASDISQSAIMHASLGRYSEYEVERGVSSEMLAKYFQEAPGGWRVKEELRRLVDFDRRNLLDSMTGLEPFDVIFCRNVAIYFEPEVQRDLFTRLADRLSPDGYLFVGTCELLTNVDPRFVGQNYCGSVFYQPNKPAAVSLG